MNGHHEPIVIDTQQVHSAIVAALSHDQSIRAPAEGLIRNWENDAAPGFLSSLLDIVKLHQSIEPVSVSLLYHELINAT